MREQELRRAIEREAGVAAYHHELGSLLQDRGSLDEAIACYRRALRLHPGFAEAWNDLGTARYARGELEAAADCYRQALRLRPDHLVAHANLGAVCRKLGLPGEARHAFQRELVLRFKNALLSLWPRRPDPARAALESGNFKLAAEIAQKTSDMHVYNAARGRVLAAAGKIDEAAAAFEEVLKREPDSVDALAVLAEQRLRRGETPAGEALLRQVLELNPLHVMARARLGGLALQAGRLDEAEAMALGALGIDDEAPAAHVVLGMAHKARGRAKKAKECFERALELNPRQLQAIEQLVHLLREEERTAEAEKLLRGALRERPDEPALLADLGMILADQMRYDDALAAFDRALAAAPRSVAAINRKALLLDHLGQRAQALELLHEALRLAPQDAYASYNLGLHHLKHGEFAGGWEGYERRRSFDNFVGRYRRFPLPEWDGGALEGRAVLVLPEQGLGDEIMFGSCVPDVAARARHVILECDPKLEAIFRRSFAGCTVVSRQRTLANDWITRVEPRPELQLAAGSLARRFRNRPEDFPPRPFLKADPAAVAAWKAKLEALGPGRKIGLSWRGGVGFTGRTRRSLSLEQLAPVLRLPGVHFVNLQYTDARDEIRACTDRYSLRIEHWQDAIDDYDQTAALVCALDGVLTVCTAIVHLAGALGRPALVMVPFGADWRYGASGERMVWYPSVRLLRQSRVGEWTGVLEEVSRRIRTAEWP